MKTNILPYKQEFYRKIIHLTALIFPFMIYKISHPYNLLFIFSITFILFILDHCRLNFNFINEIFKYFLSKVTRKYEMNSYLSATYMLLSFSIILLIFDAYLCAIAMIISVISDTIAAFVGMKYGKIIIVNDKTLEGSYSFLISTVLILFFFYFNQSTLILIVVSVISTITELFSSTKFDNFTLPIVNAILIYILL